MCYQQSSSLGDIMLVMYYMTLAAIHYATPIRKMQKRNW